MFPELTEYVTQTSETSFRDILEKQNLDFICRCAAPHTCKAVTFLLLENRAYKCTVKLHVSSHCCSVWHLKLHMCCMKFVFFYCVCVCIVLALQD